MSSKKTPKKVMRDPFEEYSDIGKDPLGNYDFIENGKTVLSEYENEQKDFSLKGTVFPVSPYDTNKITKRSTSLGREKKTYSLSGELIMRIDLLNARIKQDRRECGMGTKGCTTSKLMEEGMRYVLKKYRYKYKDLPTDK